MATALTPRGTPHGQRNCFGTSIQLCATPRGNQAANEESGHWMQQVFGCIDGSVTVQTCTPRDYPVADVRAAAKYAKWRTQAPCNPAMPRAIRARIGLRATGPDSPAASRLAMGARSGQKSQGKDEIWDEGNPEDSVGQTAETLEALSSRQEPPLPSVRHPLRERSVIRYNGSNDINVFSRDKLIYRSPSSSSMSGSEHDVTDFTDPGICDDYSTPAVVKVIPSFVKENVDPSMPCLERPFKQVPGKACDSLVTPSPWPLKARLLPKPVMGDLDEIADVGLPRIGGA